MNGSTKCIECQKDIEPKAKLCVECGAYQDRRRHIKTWTPLLGFSLAFLAFIFSIAPQLRSSLFPSPPKLSTHLRSVTERDVTFFVSNLGERRLIIDPVLKCVSAEHIAESIVDYEEPFRVWYTTVEGLLDFPLMLAELGGSEVVTFTIPEGFDGSWLENAPVFLPPEDERVSGIERSFSPGLRHTWFGASRSSVIPTYHIIGKEGYISLQPVSEIATFCQLTIIDPVTSDELNEGFAIWKIGENSWDGDRAQILYSVLGSLITLGGDPAGLNETDPELCNSESPPWGCIPEEEK